jgi:hypothetical protein
LPRVLSGGFQILPIDKDRLQLYSESRVAKTRCEVSSTLLRVRPYSPNRAEATSLKIGYHQGFSQGGPNVLITGPMLPPQFKQAAEFVSGHPKDRAGFFEGILSSLKCLEVARSKTRDEVEVRIERIL